MSDPRDIEKQIAEAIVRRCEAWGDPDCEGHAKWFAPEVKRLLEAAYLQGWHIADEVTVPPIDWDALLSREETP